MQCGHFFLEICLSERNPNQHIIIIRQNKQHNLSAKWMDNACWIHLSLTFQEKDIQGSYSFFDVLNVEKQNTSLGNHARYT